MQVQSYRFLWYDRTKCTHLCNGVGKMPQRSVAMTYIQVFACNDGMSNVFFSVTDGVFHRVSLCQIACNSGGEGTPGPMQVFTFYLFLISNSLYTERFNQKLGFNTIYIAYFSWMLLINLYPKIPYFFIRIKARKRSTWFRNEAINV